MALLTRLAPLLQQASSRTHHIPSVPNRRSSRTPGRGFEPEGDPEQPGRLPPGLSDLPWELPHTFLGLDEEATDFGKCRAVILPVPYETTTSYGGGARSGPGAIIEASRYIELYDQELGTDPSTVGIHTLPAPAIRAQAARVERLNVLQLDAHADLRAEFEGSAHSHACAMARVLDVADVVSVGVRGVSEEEVGVADAHEGITLIWADEMWEDDTWIDRALAALGDPVYLTFDVDYFDPSLVPSTGTPEPGGGDWYRTLRFLRRVFRERSVVACDVVELAPTPGVHAPDLLVAKLVYKLIGYRFEGE